MATKSKAQNGGQSQTLHVGTTKGAKAASTTTALRLRPLRDLLRNAFTGPHRVPVGVMREPKQGAGVQSDLWWLRRLVS